jgi:hypothetical protein
LSTPTTCSAASLAAGEALGGTATSATDWLLVEVRGAWGHDAVAESGLPSDVAELLVAVPEKVILIRRPDRRRGVTVIHATVTEQGGRAARQELGSLDDLLLADLRGGDPVLGPVLLVCAHGRRDACCARLGVPLFDALTAHVDPGLLWQASHLGGHRFAPNLVSLPHGVQLGRIPPARAAEVVALLAAGRIPLELYRGRTVYGPDVQVAEVAVRRLTGCDRIAGLRLLRREDDVVSFETPSGELSVRVTEDTGPAVPASCGADPEPTRRFVASLESAA